MRACVRVHVRAVKRKVHVHTWVFKSFSQRKWCVGEGSAYVRACVCIRVCVVCVCVCLCVCVHTVMLSCVHAVKRKGV